MQMGRREHFGVMGMSCVLAHVCVCIVLLLPELQTLNIDTFHVNYTTVILIKKESCTIRIILFLWGDI